MKEFEVRDFVLTSDQVSNNSKLIMLAILRNVNWETWKATMSQSYLKQYIKTVSISTIKRSLAELESVSWINRDTTRVKARNSPTVITVNINRFNSNSVQNEPSVKLNSVQNEPSVKMNSVQIDTNTVQNEPTSVQIEPTCGVKLNYNTINNNNTIYNNEEDSQKIGNSRAYYRDLYLELYKVDIDQPLSYMDQGDIDFIVEYDIIPSWKRLDQYSKQDLRDELRKRATCLNIPTQSMMLFFNKEKKRELS
jgi:hypothetical protein